MAASDSTCTGDDHRLRPDERAPPLGGTAFALGFAGLSPQLAAIVLLLAGQADAALLALAYSLLILSFLGGMWWGLASRDPDAQDAIVTLAVMPSLVALAIAAFAVVALPWALVAAGCAVMLTLPGDRWLLRRDDAPANWMRLRVPLSLGLGTLTIAAGALSASP